MRNRTRTAIFSILLGLACVLSFAGSAMAGTYFEATLPAWQGRGWCAGANKTAGSTTYYVELSSSSPNGGHFWVDDDSGTYIGAGIDLERGEYTWGAYVNAHARAYGGYATLYGRAIGNGPISDYVTSWYDLNG